MQALEALQKLQFSHLHNHSQYSILQSTSSVAHLVKAAVPNKMPAVALTDTGNMMGAFVFVKEILNHNQEAEQPIKPIVGCEFNVCENHLNKSLRITGIRLSCWRKEKRAITIWPNWLPSHISMAFITSRELIRTD